jgi:hypothetical protein
MGVLSFFISKLLRNINLDDSTPSLNLLTHLFRFMGNNRNVWPARYLNEAWCSTFFKNAFNDISALIGIFAKAVGLCEVDLKESYIFLGETLKVGVVQDISLQNDATATGMRVG